ncbi:hypothetical protein L0F51_12930 [Afifella sp. H1R]|uniref:hypothetical protein n=1 Tax=Afifella sp. H1R TaxID=2908841 RepID=UPI001F44A612|nr:hypothetical protein [Afifella sp. H1R]MCF1504654.1 hypothetical protein [Afifella sp. H1R]
MIEEEYPKTEKGFSDCGWRSPLKFAASVSSIAIVVALCLKIYGASWDFSAATVSATDVIAIVISLFAIALSFAFYYAANQAADKFYDNTYKFTKDTSEILGRIEERFGERLRHIDEGYGKIENHIGRMSVLKQETQAEIEKNEETVASEREEIKEIIKELIDKTQSSDSEKQEYQRKIDDAEARLRQSQDAVIGLRRQLKNLEKEMITIGRGENKNTKIKELLIGLFNFSGVSPWEIIEKGHIKPFVWKDLPHGVRLELMRSGLVTPEGTLTKKGVEQISEEFLK